MRQPAFARRHSVGFTLIEVMIAILVLGVGLLGFALLQTMSVRFTKSAQQRTVATTLAAAAFCSKPSPPYVSNGPKTCR